MPTYDHTQVRNLFIVGPVALYISEAPAQEIKDALDQVYKLGLVSARALGKEVEGGQPIPQPTPDLPPLGVMNEIELDCALEPVERITTVQDTITFQSLRAALATNPQKGICWNGKWVHAWRYAGESDWRVL